MVSEAVGIDSSVDLLDDSALKDVASLESLHCLGVGFLGYSDLFLA